MGSSGNAEYMGSVDCDNSKHQQVLRKRKWLAQSKPLENPLEEKHQGSSLQQRLLEKALLQLEEKRSHIDTGQEQWLSVKSEDTKNLLSYCYASYHSNVWSVKSRKISRQIFGSNLAQSWRCKKLPRPTWLVQWRIPTCVPSMPNE